MYVKKTDISLAAFNAAVKELQEQTGNVVISIYIAVLGRDPDFNGWIFWLSNLRGGVPPNAMVQQFINSPEFDSTYGSLNNTQFVQLVYQNVLGRPAEPGGLAFWVGRLDAGMPRGDVMYAFSSSLEFQARIRNRSLADLLYLGFLRRSPEPAGQAFWLNELNNGLQGANAIDPFINSVEYLARF